MRIRSESVRSWMATLRPDPAYKAQQDGSKMRPSSEDVATRPTSAFGYTPARR